MKKNPANYLTVAALVLSLGAGALSIAALNNRPEDQTHLIDDLYQQNQQLRTELEDMTARLERLETVVSLQKWTLDTTAWADSTGADVTLTATPSGYQEGVTATFLVKLDGKEVSSIPCQWNGTDFTATASLDAADGYSYYCILVSPGGTRHLSLSSPENPVPEIPVFLLSSLSSYCNLTISDWEENGGNLLVLTNACAQVQLPLVVSGGSVRIVSANLVLRLNGANSTLVPIQLNPSEVAGSFDLTITNGNIPMPALEEGDILELYLEVRLSDGRNLQAFGISWQLNDGELTSAVG